jgi:hypothetical protein
MKQQTQELDRHVRKSRWRMANSAAHWRQCAHKSRRLADLFSDPLVRNTLLDFARSYERLAIHAEAEVGRGPPALVVVATKALSGSGPT